MSRQREVPQFINIQDKIAFQLTAKQLGWIGVGVFLGFMAWTFLEKTYFLITTFFIIIGVLAILFIKPFGQELPVFIKNIFTFAFKPKVYIWKKEEYRKEIIKKIKKKEEKIVSKKKVDSEEIKRAIKNLNIYE
jgi:predicted membrane channel-forming protein YqfA (hemolysin III family)